MELVPRNHCFLWLTGSRHLDLESSCPILPPSYLLEAIWVQLWPRSLSILGKPLDSIKERRTMHFLWQHYKILSQMRATSVQRVVGVDWAAVRHVSVDCDTNQDSTLVDRQEIEFYHVPSASCHICKFHHFHGE